MDSTNSASNIGINGMTASSDPRSPAMTAPIHHRLLIPLGNLLFRIRNVVFPIVFIVLAALFPPVWLAGDARSDLWLDLAGIAIAVGGQALRYAVIGLAYIKRGGLNKQIFADKLVTTGLFAHCRNPLYVGNYLMMMGLIFIHHSPWMYVLGGTFFTIAYLAITLAEEQYLRGKFGQEYVDYCQRVPRVLVRTNGLRATLTGMSFDWRKALNKEHGTTMTWTSTLLGLLAWERITNAGWEASRNYCTILLAAWVLAAMVWTVVRVLKKRKLLE